MSTPSAPLTSSLVTNSSIFSSTLISLARLSLEMNTCRCAASIDASRTLTVRLSVSNSKIQLYASCTVSIIKLYRLSLSTSNVLYLLIIVPATLPTLQFGISSIIIPSNVPSGFVVLKNLYVDSGRTIFFLANSCSSEYASTCFETLIASPDSTGLFRTNCAISFNSTIFSPVSSS